MNVSKIGMLAVSRAGHDLGRLFVIVDEDEEYVFLSDGKIRTIENPKKKKVKHIQIIKGVPEEVAECYSNGLTLKNEMIRKAIKIYNGKLVRR